MTQQPTNPELALVQAFFDEKKAEDVLTIDVDGYNPFASYIVLATLGNPRSLGAYADELENKLYEAKIDVSVHEGEPDSGWVIIQGQDVIVHFMLAGNRRMLNLEELIERIKSKHEKTK